VRGSLVEWSRHNGLEPAAHHRLLISKLEAVERGECRRLLVMMPPGEAVISLTAGANQFAHICVNIQEPIKLTMPGAGRRAKFEQPFVGLLQQDLEGRVAPFDLAAAEAAAALAAERRRKGRPIEVRDTQLPVLRWRGEPQ